MIDRLISRFPLFLPLLVLCFSTLSSSFQVTSSSPCQSVCASSVVGTTADAVVCLKNQFASTTNGTNFQQCVECELGSTAVDSSNGATDVTWGLYNLRFALSTCVFGFPIEKVSLSTPCQVSCTPLHDAITHNLDTNVTLEDLSYCTLPSFQDTVGINRCAACYGRVDSQAYMANFLQALHIACLQPPRPSQPFPVTASTIFNSTPIATPTPSPTALPGPHKPVNLALIISLPVCFGVLILALTIGCCFWSARHRRRIMAERNGMRRIQDKTSPAFPPDHPRYIQQQQGQMQSLSPQGFDPAPLPEPVYYSPITTDRKENPYIHLSPISPSPLQQQQQQQPQYPTSFHKSNPHSYTYSPADYALPQSPRPLLPVPIDTSQIGPGPDQKKVSNLHDSYFPPPPPPPQIMPSQLGLPPSQLAMSPSQLAMPHPPPPPPPPAAGPQTQDGVESLRSHHMKTPSLGMPTPRSRAGGKKSLEINTAQGGVEEEEGGIPLVDYKEGGEKGEVESPQVFVYDQVRERYVKEGT